MTPASPGKPIALIAPAESGSLITAPRCTSLSVIASRSRRAWVSSASVVWVAVLLYWMRPMAWTMRRLARGAAVIHLARQGRPDGLPAFK